MRVNTKVRERTKRDPLVVEVKDPLAFLDDMTPEQQTAWFQENSRRLHERIEQAKRPAFFVKHRTAQETSMSGYRPPDLPWEYDGPFLTFEEARVRWGAIHPNWQEGGVVTKCGECGEYRWVKP